MSGEEEALPKPAARQIPLFRTKTTKEKMPQGTPEINRSMVAPLPSEARSGVGYELVQQPAARCRY